jgi:hypothetical protein
MGVAVSEACHPISVEAVDRFACGGRQAGGEAEAQARVLDADGPVLLARIETRLAKSAHITELPDPLAPDKLTDPVVNARGRAEALHALANAFALAAERLRSAA